MTGKLSSRRDLLLLAGAMAAPAQAVPASTRPPMTELGMRLSDPLPGRTTVAVTLDACPGAFDHRLARLLVEAVIPATVFVAAGWLRRNPEGLAFLTAHRDLFAIENHGWRHVPPVIGRRVFGLQGASDLAAVREEVERGAQAVVAATGVAPRWYRAATGFYGEGALPVIRGTGALVAGYSLNADMGASLPAARVAARIAGARNGDVIVAHINQPGRPSGLGAGEGLRRLKAAGVRFVRLGDLGPADVRYG